MLNKGWRLATKRVKTTCNFESNGGKGRRTENLIQKKTGKDPEKDFTKQSK